MGVFRLLLALAVIAEHTSAILGTTLVPGAMAVQVFFMISGFYMALVLDGRYALDAKGLKLFYSNRMLRLYPAFIAVTLGIWAQFLLTWMILGRVPGNAWMAEYEVMSWPVKLALIATNWLMVGTDVFSNMHFSAEHGAAFLLANDPPMQVLDGMTFMHGIRTIGPAWSIGTEIWFYLLVPFLVRLRWPWLLAVFAGSLACRLWISEGLGKYPYFFFPAQLMFFVAGMWAHQIYRRWVAPAQTRPWQRYVVLANWALVLAYPFCLSWLPSGGVYVWVGLSLPFMFGVTKDLTWDRFIGDLSYPVYLVHLWVHSIIERFAGVSGTLVAVASVLLALGIMLVIEKPVEKFRRRRVAAANLPKAVMA